MARATSVPPDPGRGVLHHALLNGRHAIVTGGAGGIGAAVACELAAAGAEVTVFDVVDPLETVESITRLGGAARGDRLDVRDREAVKRSLDRIDHAEILVTSAGIYGQPTELAKLATTDLERVMAVNLYGTLWCIESALPLLRQKGGNIVCIGSAAGETGGVSAGPHYVASKGAIHAVVKWVARAEAKHGIIANAIAPGAIDTT